MKLNEFKLIYETGECEVEDEEVVIEGVPCWYPQHPHKQTAPLEPVKQQPVVMGPTPSREIGFHTEMGQMGREAPFVMPDGATIQRLPGEVQIMTHVDGGQTIFRPVSNGQFISTYLTPTQAHRNRLAAIETNRLKLKSRGLEMDGRLGAIETV